MFSWLFSISDRLRHEARRRRWPPDRAMGRRGEDLAHRYLATRGLKIVARNWRTRSGSAEVDLIARDGGVVVFVEVKSRESDEHGGPERAVGVEKARRMIAAASEYLRRTEPAPVRFDIVSVILADPPVIRHMRDVFSAGQGFGTL